MNATSHMILMIKMIAMQVLQGEWHMNMHETHTRMNAMIPALLMTTCCATWLFSQHPLWYFFVVLLRKHKHHPGKRLCASMLQEAIYDVHVINAPGLGKGPGTAACT